MWFVLIKSWSKYAKQNKTLKLEFCEETSSATCAIFIFGVLKAGVWAPKRFSLRKKLFCYIFKNQGGFDYCYTKVDSLAKFERNRFPNPKRTGPLLKRLRLNFSTSFDRFWQRLFKNPNNSSMHIIIWLTLFSFTQIVCQKVQKTNASF